MNCTRENDVFGIRKFCDVYRLRIDGKAYRPVGETEGIAKSIVLDHNRSSDLFMSVARQCRLGKQEYIYRLDPARSTLLFDCENLLLRLCRLGIKTDYFYSQFSRSFFIQINSDPPQAISVLLSQPGCVLL